MTHRESYYNARALAMELRASECGSSTRRADFLKAAEGWRALARLEAQRRADSRADHSISP